MYSRDQECLVVSDGDRMDQILEFLNQNMSKFGLSHLIPTVTISEGVNGERILSDVFSPKREQCQI
jgi:hypothetical protein